MKMEFEIISKEFIKPSSPTPHHLKTYKISLVDQCLPLVYVPLVLYFPMNQDSNFPPTDFVDIVSTRLQLLKQSLSKILPLFFPFAGKIKDHLSIDCNDEGVYFVTARVESSLNEFLNHPNISLINKFLPDESSWSPSTPGNYVAGVQVTTFSCGSIAVGTIISHMVVDGMSIGFFLKSWAAAMTQKNNTTEVVLRPNFDASFLFPQSDACPRQASPTPYFKRLVNRRFTIDASAIAKLKAKATSSGVKTPSRVEVVSALLSKRITAALKARPDSDKPFLLTHVVNLRQRATPPFSENYMGNILGIAYALCNPEEAELHDWVCQLREAITKLNGDLVNSLQGEAGFVKFLEAAKYASEIQADAEARIWFTSWCNFGFYGIDFGWGKPVWASVPNPDESNTVTNGIILMDTKLGNGIEAWMYWYEDEMAIIEADEELLEFATVDSSPLNLNKEDA